MIDSHCHLDHEPLLSDLSNVLKRSKEVGIEKLLTISTSFESFSRVKELVNNFTAANDKGYVLFLEEQLKKAETKIENMHKVIGKKKNPGYCVECFTNIGMSEIICGKCQDERDERHR